METCKICDRVPFGKLIPLGFGNWRHQACHAGSVAWKEYYQRLGTKGRTALLVDVYSCLDTGGALNDALQSEDHHRSTSAAPVLSQAQVTLLGATSGRRAGRRGAIKEVSKGCRKYTKRKKTHRPCN